MSGLYSLIGKGHRERWSGEIGQSDKWIFPPDCGVIAVDRSEENVRNVLARAGKQGRRVVSAFIGTAFAQQDADAARFQWRQLIDRLRSKVPKLAVPAGYHVPSVLLHGTRSGDRSHGYSR